MKSYGRPLVFVVIMIVALLGSITALCALASAAPTPKDRDKEKEHEGKNVDSGSFSVYQNGHRVGTETFSIYQTNAGSTIHSEFKSENTPPDVQTSDLQLTAAGDMHRYEWRELSPEQAQSVVLPNEEFLNQKWSSGATDKEHEQPYLLPTSTMILDDYFFIHREVLAWRYLASACKQEKNQVQCPLKQRAQMGTLNPHQHASAAMSVEFLGREKVNLKGGPQDLLKLELKNESGTWQLWLDDQFKVMRMSIVGENTEVIRD
ncbi:MAG: hypothetical protein WBD45_15660 [Terriglobales bacterium]